MNALCDSFRSFFISKIVIEVTKSVATRIKNDKTSIMLFNFEKRFISFVMKSCLFVFFFCDI